MLYAIVAVVVLILDQAVKYWTNVNLDLGSVEEFIPGVFNLTNHHNTGAAWGLLNDVESARWIFVALTVVFCGVIIFLLAKNIVKGKLGRWMLVLVMAGGIGNCIDRIINGYVVDMFQFGFWESFPIFNVADIFVSVCGVIFCLWLIFHKSEEPEKPLPKPRGTASRPADRKSVPPAKNADYITQLKRPVAEAKVVLENQRAVSTARQPAPSADRTADFSQWNIPVDEVSETSAAANAYSKTDTASDPFAEFYSKPAPTSAPETTAAPVPERAPASPAATKAPSGAAPKKRNEEFSLEDILAEFSDK